MSRQLMVMNSKTSMLPKEKLERKWFLVDASGWVLGRLATRISNLLQGKGKVWYTPHLDCGDTLVVINTSKIVLTGNKWKDKIYYSHSNYPGGLKKHSAQDLFNKSPNLLLKKAVARMLPKNKLQDERMRHLFLFPNEQHSHHGQKPEVLNWS